MTKEDLIKNLRTIPDFPIKGILFYDVTTLFKQPAVLKGLADNMYEVYKDKGITKVVGIESRGFIVGAALAYRLNAGFIPIRKPGKLPYEKVSIEYKKEYGFDRVEMHKDSINPNDVVLIHDDLLATGGTLLAACELVNSLKPKKIFVNCIIELTNFHAKEKFPKDCPVDSFIAIDEFEGVN